MSDMSGDAVRDEITIAANGRVTIPAQIRRTAGITPGQTLVIYVEDGRVVMETREQLAARIKREFAAADTGTGSAAEELLADRRADAAREEAEA